MNFSEKQKEYLNAFFDDFRLAWMSEEYFILGIIHKYVLEKIDDEFEHHPLRRLPEERTTLISHIGKKLSKYEQLYQDASKDEYGG